MQIGQPGGGIPATDMANRAAVGDHFHGQAARGHQGNRQLPIVRRVEQVGRLRDEDPAQRARGLPVQAVPHGQEAGVREFAQDGLAPGTGGIEQEAHGDARVPQAREQGQMGAVDGGRDDQIPVRLHPRPRGCRSGCGKTSPEWAAGGGAVRY